MAKPKKTPGRPSKPLLASAVFCDKVLKEEKGVMSAIRIIDTVTVSGLSSLNPEERVPIPLEALIGFKSGNAEGERNLRLELRTPTGKKAVVMERPISFLGGELGVNLHVKIDLRIKTEGLYWVDVFV